MASSICDTNILPSPMRPGLRRGADRLDRRREVFVRDDDLDLHFGQKVDDIFGAAIELGMALLAAEALRLEDGDALGFPPPAAPPSPRRA